MNDATDRDPGPWIFLVLVVVAIGAVVWTVFDAFLWTASLWTWVTG